jgi:heme-degrading monooxygenase HmoA
MTTAFIQHKVTDYADWKAVYDSVGEMQKHDGVIAQAVYQSVEDPNDVTVTHEFATLEAAQTFLASDDLKQAMEHAHVASKPIVWFGNKV